MKYSLKHLEKSAGAIGNLMGVGSILDFKNKAMENKSKVQIEPTQEREQQLQLPDSRNYQFEGGKRIDSSAVTATNKY